jgi:uncharacterized protein
VAVLGASPRKLLNDLNLFGFLFESLVVRDLRIFGQANDAEVLHYRDSTELEVDAIVEARDGRWSAFEVELGGEENIEEAAANLLTFADRIDTRKSGVPACLGVIVGNGLGYVRKDGRCRHSYRRVGSLIDRLVTPPTASAQRLDGIAGLSPLSKERETAQR